jgi:PAS domain S-box-containing protein
MAATGLSIILIILQIAKKSGEEKLQFANKVVNSGPVLVLGFKFDGTIIFSSENIYQLLGYHSWEIGGRNWWAQVVGRNEDVLEMLQKIVEQKETEFRVHLKHKSGIPKIFKFTGRAINNQTMVMIGQDITQNQALETRFEHLIEKAPDAIYQTDFYGNIVYANPQTSFVLGIPNEKLIGSHFSEFLREDQRESVIDFYNEQFRNRLPSTYSEFPVTTKNGQTRWLGFQVSMLMSNDRKTIDGYLSIARDITERLEAEQLIQHQHKNITDSLTYANRIKAALLPSEEALKTIFTHSAVYNKPKDIIGGDFYWLVNAGKKHLFVVGDCTGHGVPGAFMTTIAVGLLRQIVKEEPGWNIEELLGLFNRALIRLLGGSSDTEMPDFAELALVSIDFEQNKIQFLSSGIGLYQFHKEEVIQHQNGSRGYNFKYDYRGLSQTIDIKPGDVFYIFTDGIYDQIGGPDSKRLNRNRLVEILKKSNQTSLSDGMVQIKKELEKWQGNMPQIDDRLIISFRF